MKDIDLAWAAGFMDGDGCFTITFAGGYFIPQISACGRDVRPIIRLKELFGGRIETSLTKQIQKFSGGKEMYKWHCTDATAYRVCKLLQPFLVLKQEQAECVIELGSLKSKWTRISDEVKLQQALLHVRCSRLNNTYIGLAATTKREGQEIAAPVCDSLDCIDDKDAESAEMTDRLILEVIK